MKTRLGIPKPPKAFDSDGTAPLAAGIVLVAPDGDVLLLRRSSTEQNYAGHWALPGGKADAGESAQDAANREAKEEIGLDIDMEAVLKLIDRTQTPNGMEFSTFARPVKDKFTPTLNSEHSGFAWASLDMLPQPLHPEVKRVLGEHLGAAEDMTPEDWKGLRDGFLKWTVEEQDEPEHVGASDQRMAMDRSLYDRSTGKRIMAADRMALDRAPSVRQYDADGHMHIARTPISKANVCEYYGHEIPHAEELGLEPERKYRMLRHPDELAKGAKSSNGKKLMLGHVPVSADEPQKDKQVGATGTDAEYEHPYLYNSLHVHDREGIDAIHIADEDSKDPDGAKELSSAYRYDPDMTPGEYEGAPYDGIMRNIDFNHVALVPEGRAGADVVVGDSQIQPPKDTTMKKVLTRFAGGSVMALGVYLKPKLAADAKIDLIPIFDGVTKANFAEKKVKIAADINTAVKGKLAKDASLNDLQGTLDTLVGSPIEEGADIEPNSGLPMTAAEMASKAKDADPMAKIHEMLKGKLSAEDLKACDDMMGYSEPGMDSESEESEENAEGAEGEGAAKEVKDAKGIDKKAMDAAIKTATDSTEKRIKEQFSAAAEAREFVRPYVGTVSMALDSADAIYRAALDGLKVSHKGLHPDALKPILEAQPKPGAKKIDTIAQDSARHTTSTGFQSRWGEQASNIGEMTSSR